MAKRVSELRTANKSANTSREYLLLSNIDTNSSTKLALNDVLPTLQSGKTSGGVTSGTDGVTVQDIFVGGGVGSSTTNTDKSVLIFKGLNVEDAGGALSIRTDTSTADGTKKNIVIKLAQASIDLNSADNTTSLFLSESGGANVLTLSDSSHYTGDLPVAAGGTGVSTLLDGGLLVGNGTGAVSAMALLLKGSLVVGTSTGASTDPAALVVGVDGRVLIADSTETYGVKWGKPSIDTATLTGTLNTSNNHIDLGSGFITGTGTGTAGIRLSTSSDYSYIGGSTPFFSTFLNVEGGITLGNSSGSSAQSLVMKSCSSGAGPALSIQGSTSVNNNNGGDVNILGGAGETAGDGGNITVQGGVKAGGGADGTIVLKTGGINALTIDTAQDTVLDGNLKITSATDGIVHTGRGAVTQLTNHSTAVNLNATSGIITLYVGTFPAGGEAEFRLINTAIGADSLVLLSMQGPAAASENDAALIVAQAGDITTGVLDIRLTNPGSGNTSGIVAYKIHFLIINN
jgi:hypothetical protein